MPGNTTNLNLPYPLGNETADPATDIKNLAEAIDAKVKEPFGIKAATYDGANNQISLTIAKGIGVFPNARVITSADSTFNIASPAINTTYFVYLLSNGTFSSNTTGSVPGGTDGSILLATVATGVTTDVLTIVDKRGLIDGVASAVAAHLANSVYQTAGGTATAITLTISETLTNGFAITFIASANNNGAATTINGKSLYKPNTTTSPTLIAGKAYTVWYNSTQNCFFIKASAEGNTVAAHVLAGDTFSNEVDTGLTGSMPNNGAETKALAVYTLQNIITNGSFESDLTGWSGGTIDTTYKKFGSKSAKITSPDGSSVVKISQNYPASLINGHKYYMSGNFMRTSTLTNSVEFDVNPGEYGNIVLSGSALSAINTWYFKSAVFTVEATLPTYIRVFTFDINPLYIDGSTLIDLTATFGAGYEPTQAQMDAIMTTLGGWFDTSVLVSKIPSGAYITNGTTGMPDILVEYAYPHNYQAYTTPGTYTFTVPANVTKINVFVVGAGGGGASCAYYGCGGGGGAGGLYADQLSVVPGTQYSITVGAGGLGGVGTNGYDTGAYPQPGSAGGSSSFGSYTAGGGGAGGIGSTTTRDTGGSGGTGGTGGGTFGSSGGAGGRGGDVYQPADNRPGGVGGHVFGTYGQGGGGGSMSSSGYFFNGGNGANGAVIITW